MGQSRTYCALALGTDGAHLYFIHMDRCKESKTVPVMRSADAVSGRWQKCTELCRTGDPALLFDQLQHLGFRHGDGVFTESAVCQEVK